MKQIAVQKSNCGFHSELSTYTPKILIVSDSSEEVKRSLFRFLTILGTDPNFSSYDEFFSNSRTIKADLIFLRSSRFFSNMIDDLKLSVENFKINNPNSRVVFTLLDNSLEPSLKICGADRIELGWTIESGILKEEIKKLQ